MGHATKCRTPSYYGVPTLIANVPFQPHICGRFFELSAVANAGLATAYENIENDEKYGWVIQFEKEGS
jgi:hypothetical protein